MTTKLGKVETSWKADTHQFTWSFSHILFCGHLRSILNIFTCIRPMATKHGKVGTLRKKFPPITSHNPLKRWQIKNIISWLSQCLWSQDLPGWWHTSRSRTRISHNHSVRWSYEVAWQVKYITSPLVIPVDTKVDKVLEMQSEAPFLKAIWPFDHMTNVRSLGILQSLYFHCSKACD